jgi:hypothetical protein
MNALAYKAASLYVGIGLSVISIICIITACLLKRKIQNNSVISTEEEPINNGESINESLLSKTEE